MVVFDDMIADMLSNKKLQSKKKKKKKKNPIVTELFIRGRKLNFMQFSFAVPKNIRLNSVLLLWKFDTKESFNK